MINTYLKIFSGAILSNFFSHSFVVGSEELMIYRGQVLTCPLTEEDLPPLHGKCRLFLIRHGETEWNVLGLSQGWEDVPLNEHGKIQADQLALCLSQIPMDAVYSSVLARAVETANKIASFHAECLVVFDGALRFYDIEKKQASSLPKAQLKAVIKAEIIENATAYFMNVAKYHSDKNVIILTHGKVIKHLVQEFNKQNYGKIKIANTGMVRFIASENHLAME